MSKICLVIRSFDNMCSLLIEGHYASMYSHENHIQNFWTRIIYTIAVTDLVWSDFNYSLLFSHKERCLLGWKPFTYPNKLLFFAHSYLQMRRFRIHAPSMSSLIRTHLLASRCSFSQKVFDSSKVNFIFSVYLHEKHTKRDRTSENLLVRIIIVSTIIILTI